MSAVERKLKKLETAAIAVGRTPCRDRMRLLNNLEQGFVEIRDDIDSIQDASLARKLAGRSGKAVDAIYHARRDTERQCRGLSGARRRR